MKNTLKIGFLAIMFAFVFVACKPKTEEVATEEVATEEAVVEEVATEEVAAEEAPSEMVDTAAVAAE